jgi:hypothetical protein
MFSGIYLWIVFVLFFDATGFLELQKSLSPDGLPASTATRRTADKNVKTVHATVRRLTDLPRSGSMTE